MNKYVRMISYLKPYVWPYFVLAMLVIMCTLFPGLQVVWTAHHLRTSTKTFTALRGICRRKKVAPLIRAMRAANGEQQVEFMNGSFRREE